MTDIPCFSDGPNLVETNQISPPRSWVTGNKDRKVVHVAIISDLPQRQLRAEATRKEETPGIGWIAFSNLFGGCRESELDWPQCSKLPGYSNFFCADVIVQPFAPDAAGKAGLVFCLPTDPTATGPPKTVIHVFSNTPHGDLCYRGDYTRVPVPEIRFDWSVLPNAVRILKLCYSSDKSFQHKHTIGSAMVGQHVSDPQTIATRAIRARIQLRNQRGREPSAMEVKAYFEHFNDRVSFKEVTTAFRSGEEVRPRDFTSP
jgi:hypothetical protein